MHYRFLAVLSHSLAGLLRTAIGFAYAYRISFKVYDAHNIVLLELTPHIGDAYGKNADCLVGCKYFCGAIVDVQFAFVDKRLYTSAGGISGTEKRNLS